MFRFLYKKIRALQKNNYKDCCNVEDEKIMSSMSFDLNVNMNTLRDIFGGSKDIIFREFVFGKNKNIQAAVIYVEGMCEKAIINDVIMKTLMYDNVLINMEDRIDISKLEIIKTNMLSVGNIEDVNDMDKVIENCLSGDTVLLIQGCNKGLSINTRAWESRGIDEPKTEAVVRGPREGFTENISTNMTLLRRKLKDPNFIFEAMRIGRKTRTSVCIAYLKNVADPDLVKEIKERLNRIDTDAILESGYIEQFIEDEPLSIFPTIGNCEKPDSTAAKILEGRVAILVDGTPFVLTVPMLFVEGFQTSEDYYSRTIFSSFIRLLRYTAFMISILAPGAYVMLSVFHQELIPTALLFTMAANREGIPFPAVMEAELMLITFEILREAGVRLPRPVGQAVSIVGALVIGEAAVSAGLVGGLMVIVTAITAVSSFVVPVYTDVGSILRMIVLIMVASLGIFGLSICFLGVLIHLTSLRSFGAPYLSPIAPFNKQGFKDTFIRMPLWKMNTRPRVIGMNNLQRQNSNLKPKKPETKE
jgi:spore germination protein KA